MTEQQAKEQAERLAKVLVEAESEYVNARNNGDDCTADYYCRQIVNLQDEVDRLLYIAQGGMIQFI